MKALGALVFACLLGLAVAAPEASASQDVRKMPDQWGGDITRIRADAEAGKPDAEFEMGRLYAEGDGVKCDLVEAARWYRRAATHGSTRAGQVVNRLEAFVAEHEALYKKAQAGDADSLYAFAWHEPHESTGLAGDAPRPHWLLLAAKAGSPEASNQIGRMYFRAYFKRRREIAGAEATAAHPDTQYINFFDDDLSDDPLDFEGESLETDLGDAILWLEKGAATANAGTLYDLARAYAITGPGRDIAKTRYWLTRAREVEPYLEPEACEIAFTGKWSGMRLGFEAGPLSTTSARRTMAPRLNATGRSERPMPPIFSASCPIKVSARRVMTSSPWDI